jgi:hypothetical protein
MKHKNIFVLNLLTALLCFGSLKAQNPFVTNQFSADPTAKVFNGKVYVFPSHDIPTPPETSLRKDWFCMEDYHVFSSDNLVDWVDHGVIVDQKQVPWVDAKSYSMWAPDCIERDGKFYFFFPANAKPVNNGRGGFGVGVGIASKPEGPYIFQEKPVAGVNGIDPALFKDKDGTYYIYWVQRGLSVAKLSENMIELASEPKALQIDGLPKPNGFKEGPYLFERKGLYYLTFPYVRNKTEELVYCTSDSPMGPFTYKGVVMDESPTGCWTNHQSMVEFKGQWYLFYHHNDLSPNFDKNRSICVDSLNFNSDGSIQKVSPTLRGVGLTPSSNKIQLDRYSALSAKGASIAFLDTTKRFDGWMTLLEAPGAWVRFNAVQFAEIAPQVLEVCIQSATGGVLEFRLDNMTSPVIATVPVRKGSTWQIISTPLSVVTSGNHDLFVSMPRKGKICIDWAKIK